MLYKKCRKPCMRDMVHTNNTTAHVVTFEKQILKTWYEKLAHQNIGQVKKLLTKHYITYENKEEFFCEGCTKGKQHRESLNECSSEQKARVK